MIPVTQINADINQINADKKIFVKKFCVHLRSKIIIQSPSTPAPARRDLDVLLGRVKLAAGLDDGDHVRGLAHLHAGREVALGAGEAGVRDQGGGVLLDEDGDGFDVRHVGHHLDLDLGAVLGLGGHFKLDGG